MTLDPVQPGSPLSAQQQNALIARVNAVARPGAAGSAQYGTAGVTFDAPADVRIGIFEMTEKMWYPSDDDPPIPPGLGGVPDVPYTLAARRIWVSHADNQYNQKSDSPDTVLYQPTCLRDTGDVAWSTPGYGIGSRVAAVYNRQSGRWEILERPPYTARIELAEGEVYMPGDASVNAHLIDDPDEPVVTVYPASSDHRFGIGRGGSGVHSHGGTQGYATWQPVRRRWELMTLNAKLLCEGKADGYINQGASGTVSLWWKDYATGNLVDSGRNVTALNWCGPGIRPGDCVVVSYDRQEDRWTIIEQEGGVVVTNGVAVVPARTIQFLGAGVTVAVVGGTTAQVTIP